MESVLLSNSVTFYMKLRIRLEGSRLSIDTPRSILGIVPAGRARLEFDAADIARIGPALTVRPERLLAAAALAVTAIAFTPTIPGTVSLLALAVWLLPLSLIKVLRIEDRRGRVRRIPICMFQVFDVELIASEVERARDAAHMPERARDAARPASRLSQPAPEGTAAFSTPDPAREEES